MQHNGSVSVHQSTTLVSQPSAQAMLEAAWGREGTIPREEWPRLERVLRTLWGLPLPAEGNGARADAVVEGHVVPAGPKLSAGGLEGLPRAVKKLGAALLRAGEPLSLEALAAQMGLEKSGVRKTLKGAPTFFAEQLGVDGRGHLWTLTSAGERLFRDAG
jgi:hypothetical protein